MFGLLEKENGVLEDEGVRCASKAAQEARALLDQLELDERRLLRIVNPLPNDPDSTDEQKEEAFARLKVRPGTQNAWFLDGIDQARAASKKAQAALGEARAQAVARLDAARSEARRPLIADFARKLDALFASREAVLAFDAEWAADRDTSLMMPQMTTLEPILTRGQVENLKTILRAQGWL